MSFKEYKSENEDESPFPIEGASSSIVYFPHYQKSSYKVYVYGGTGRFSSTHSVKDLYELSIPNLGSAETAPPKWRCLVTQAAAEELEDYHVPQPRWNHTLTHSPLVNKLFMFGGEFGTIKHNDPNIYELDLSSGDFVWTQLATASESINKKTKIPLKPLPRCKHTCVASTGGKPYLYVFGGYNSVLDVELADLWRFDIEQKTWKLLHTGPLHLDQAPPPPPPEDKIPSTPPPKKLPSCPRPRCGHTMTISPKSDALYVIGGCSKDVPYKEVWKFNLKTNQWEAQAFDCSEPIMIQEKRKSLDLSALTQKNAVNKDDIVNYKLPFYIPARGSTAVMFGSCIIIQGGETLMDEVDPVLKDILVYDTSNGRLAKFDVGDSKTALVNHTMVLHQDKLIILGGKYGWPYFNSGMFTLSMLELPKLKAMILNKQNQVVGIGLDELLARESDKKHIIPTIFAKLIDYLMQKGLDEQNIFRLSASASELNGIRLRFEQGIPAADVDLDRFNNVHAVASFLKLLIRELPEPVFPFETFDKVLAVYEKEPAKPTDLAVKELKSIVDALPTAHKGLLLALLALFKSVSARENMTKMNSDAVARCVTFSLLMTKTRQKEQQLMVQQDNPLIKAVTTLIDNVDKMAK